MDHLRKRLDFLDMTPGYMITRIGSAVASGMIGSTATCTATTALHIRGMLCMFQTISVAQPRVYIGRLYGYLGLVLAHVEKLVGVCQRLASYEQDCANHDGSRKRNPKLEPQTTPTECTGVCVCNTPTQSRTPGHEIKRTTSLQGHGHGMKILLAGATRQRKKEPRRLHCCSSTIQLTMPPQQNY